MDDTQQQKKSEFTWQKSLLPFMSRTIVVLSVFFFLASLVQLIYMHKTIADKPKVDLKTVFTTLDSSKVHFTSNDIITGTRLKSLVVLESGAMENQYFRPCRCSIKIARRGWCFFHRPLDLKSIFLNKLMPAIVTGYLPFFTVGVKKSYSCFPSFAFFDQ